MGKLTLVSSNASFGGFQKVFSHESSQLKCKMNFAMYFPCESPRKLPVLYWLSGLTCNEQNFITKAGAQKYLILQFILQSMFLLPMLIPFT